MTAFLQEESWTIGKIPTTVNPTLEELWYFFSEHKLPSEKGRETETSRWNRHIQPILGNMEARDISTLTLLKYSKVLEKKKLSPQTIKHVLGLIRRIMRHASKWDIYTGKIPYFPMPKFDNGAQRFLTRDEAFALLLELRARSEIWHDFATLALMTGMRASELFKLTHQYLDLKNKYFNIFDAKGFQSRLVPMNPVAEETILKYLDTPRGQPFFAIGHPKGYHQVSSVYRKAVRACGLNSGITDRRQKVTFHTLRHTAASWMVQNGTDLLVVSRILGHSSLKVTMRYAHLAPTQSVAAVASLASFRDSHPIFIS